MEKKSIKRKMLLHIVTKLHILFTNSQTENSLDLSLSIKIVSAFCRWSTCEGASGLKRAKTMSNCFTRHLMGTPLESVPLSNRYKRLIDKALLQSTCRLSKIYWVSVFSTARLFYSRPVVDVSTITGGFEGRLLGLIKIKYLIGFRNVTKSFSRANKFVPQDWNATFKWHISGAGGPNGPVSYTQYLNDLRALRKSRLLIGIVYLFVVLPYDNKWVAALSIRDAFLQSMEKGEESSIHSRLIFLSDKGGKTRVIAMGDILSQSILKTVHQRCNIYLKHITQDGTFDQDRSRRFIKKMTVEPSAPLASIDLTAATDRMPALFQMLVLVSLRILNPLQALGWWWVTTRRDFSYREGGSPTSVRYTVGQPMGLLSSWPVMAISHHFLVRMSFSVQGYQNLEKCRYSVLGDDLTLLDHDVAETYLDLIDCLGMRFSPDKTYISFGVAEFAKSLFRYGEDLTPFPVALLVFNRNTIVSNTFAIISDCARIKLPVTSSDILGSFPKRWRNLVLLAMLSSSSPKSALDLQPRDDHWIFLQFVYLKKIKYFSRVNTVKISTADFVINNPSNSTYSLASPYLQIAKDNSESYPVRDFKEDSLPLVLLGNNWISYSTSAWPNGLPPLGSHSMVPGPVWKDTRDDMFSRSALTELDRLMPGYFYTRCVGKQVGE